jgi:uncharacterized protein
VDLKADRGTSTLLVPTLTPEPGAPDFTEPLAAELRQLADWLELEHIKITATGAAARALSANCR